MHTALSKNKLLRFDEHHAGSLSYIHLTLGLSKKIDFFPYLHGHLEMHPLRVQCHVGSQVQHPIMTCEQDNLSCVLLRH